MTRILHVVFMTAFLLAASACGGGGYSVNPAPQKASTQALTAGNWWLVGTSNTTNNALGAQTDFGGPLTVSGNTVSVTTTVGQGHSNFHSCFSFTNPIVISGPASGANANLASAATASSYGFVLTVQGTTENAKLFDGTYQLAGGTSSVSCEADVGTVYGTYVPALSGTLAGNITETDTSAPAGTVPNVAALSIALSQGATPSIFTIDLIGTKVSAFPLSGTVTWNNATCYGSGLIDPTQSYITGNRVNIAVTNASGGYPSYAIFTTLDNPGSTMRGAAIALSPGTGPCAVYNITGLLASS